MDPREQAEKECIPQDNSEKTETETIQYRFTSPVDKPPIKGVDYQPGDIFKLIPKIMLEVKAVPKEQFNQQQKFKYRGVDPVYNATSKVFAKHGVFSTVNVLKSATSETPTKGGGTWTISRAKLKFFFWGPDSSFISQEIISEGRDTADKATYKMYSMAHKYAICMLLKLPTDDPDPDQEQQQTNGKNNPQQKPPTGKDRRKISEPQIKRLYAIMKNSNWNETMVKKAIKVKWGLDSKKDLTMSQYDILTKGIESNPLPVEKAPEKAPEFDAGDLPPDDVEQSDFAPGEDPFEEA